MKTMSHRNEDIEKLVVRRLDGELSDEQELQLDRELLRNPQARRLLEEYAQVDDLARSALDRSFPARATPTLSPVAFGPVRPTWWRRTFLSHRGRWLIPGAVAATILAMVVPLPQRMARAPSSSLAGLDKSREPVPVVRPVPRSATDRSLTRNVDWNIPRIRRDTGRELIGVVGDDGNLYWIELEKVRTLKQRRRHPPMQRPRESL